MPMITGPGAFDPLLGKMRTKDVSGGTASGDYTFNTAEFTVGVAGLVSLNQVPASKLDTVSDIVNVTGASVTLQPNTAYKIYATSQAITLNANPPAAGKWAYEGHLEIFTAGTGYVVTGSNVVLANALEPDAVNNCTVRFHDGIAIISVEDHVAGYIVVNGSTAGDGSLYYGITTSTNDYVAFDASLNGTVIPLAGAVAEGEKHIVGNGYAETAITGDIDCSTQKVTVANLALSDVGVTGGTLTLGDAFIPSGSTVAVSGGGLAVEKVTGSGAESVIDLGSSLIALGSSSGEIKSHFVSNATIQNGSGTFGVVRLYPTAELSFNSCTIDLGGSGGVGGWNGSFWNDGTLAFSDCHFTSREVVRVEANGTVQFIGSNSFGGNLYAATGVTAGTVCISSGAIIDLTGNTNATPIAPGGGITFESGGATVKVGDSTASSSYMMNNVTLPAGAKLTNTVVVNLGGTNVVLDGTSISSASLSGCTLTSGSATYGGAVYVAYGVSATLRECSITGNSANYGGGCNAGGGSYLLVDSCVVTGNSDGDIRVAGASTSILISASTVGTVNVAGGTVNVAGSNTIDVITSKGGSGTVIISSGAAINLTSSIAPGGGITVLTGGCTVNGNAIAAGTYTSIDSNGSATV